MAAKHVFLGQVVDAWQMVGSLVGLHSLQKLHRYGAVEPGDIPLAVFTLCQVVLKVELGNFLDHIIVGMLCKHDHALLPPRYLLGIELILLVLVTAREPVRVVGRIPVAAVIPVVVLLRAGLFLILLVTRSCHDLLVVRLQREAGQICLFSLRALRSFRCRALLGGLLVEV